MIVAERTSALRDHLHIQHVRGDAEQERDQREERHQPTPTANIARSPAT